MTLQGAEISQTRFGDYEVLRYLTAGGMADLYLVRAPRSRAPLVLKCVQRRYLDNARVVAMFVDEGRIGSLLLHPNIVRVFEIGQVERQHYIAMEYISGHDLVDSLRAATARRLSVPRELGIAICAQVLRGLSHAHELRDESGRPYEIVHCDISPGNVMLSRRGVVKLVDFGVARANIPLECPERGVAGKYNYMAPEQVLGAPVDRRADLFSLGVILYELTCGHRLFRGRAEAVMRQVVDEPIPPPRELHPDYPVELQRIVMKALMKNPALRYPSAEAMRVDLSAYLSCSMKPHGRRELARFLRGLFPLEVDQPSREEGEDERLDTVDMSPMSGARRRPAPSAGAAAHAEQDDELTQEADVSGLPVAPYDDREELLLTRCDSPLLEHTSGRPLPRVALDPDRTGLVMAGRKRRHSGGITTHMFGEGRTCSLRNPRAGDRTGTAQVAIPPGDSSRTNPILGAGTRLGARLIWLALLFAACFLIGYYYAQR